MKYLVSMISKYSLIKSNRFSSKHKILVIPNKRILYTSSKLFLNNPENNKNSVLIIAKKELAIRKRMLSRKSSDKIIIVLGIANINVPV